MPRVTWSVSRDQTLQACERRYYFQYESEARLNSRDWLLREIAFLKRLRTIPAWQGQVVHELIAWWIDQARRGTVPTVEAVLSHASAKVERQWQESAAPSEWGGEGGQLRLFEHEYQVHLPPDALADILADLKRWTNRFLHWAEDAHLLETLRSARQVWIEPPTYGPMAPGFEIDGVQVVVKVDLAAQFPDGRFEIWDWKTGKPATHNPYRVDPSALQVNVYQLWPHLAFDVPIEHVRAHLVFVGSEPVAHRSLSIDGDVREYVLTAVRRSVDQVKHLDAKHGGESLGLADFDYATNVALCRTCSFKRICLRSVDEAW